MFSKSFVERPRRLMLSTKSVSTSRTYTAQVADYFKDQYQTITAVHQEDQGNSLYHAHIIINTTDVNNGKLYHSGRKELSELAIAVHDVTGNYCKPIIKKLGEK